jgi:exopolysaccharide production protein ExoZ
VLIVSLLVPGIANSSFEHPPSIWRSYLLMPDSVGPLLAVGWTLIHEMYFYLGFTLIIFMVSHLKVSISLWLAAWTSLIVIVHEAVAPSASPILAILMHPLTMEFIIGVCISLAVQRGYKNYPLLALLSGFLLFAAALVFSDNPRTLIDTLNWQHVGLIGLPCALIVYGAATLEIGGIASAPRWLVALGNASYSTYLCHVLVLSALGRLYKAIPIHSVYTEVSFVGACIIAGNCVGLASRYYIEQTSLNWLRRLLYSTKIIQTER